MSNWLFFLLVKAKLESTVVLVAFHTAESARASWHHTEEKEAL